MSQQLYSSVPSYHDPTEQAPLDETWKGSNATAASYPPLPDSNGYAATPPTQYAPYPGAADPIMEPLKPEYHHLHHWESEKPPILKTIVIQLFAFLWLVPIATLLYLNLSEHILGASAWCPFGSCDPKTDGEDSAKAVRIPAEFDRDSHNLLGSLQFAAKALEVWFILICGWLVYLITAILARRRRGLPVGYLFRSVQFAELAGLVDPLLWTTVRRRGKLWTYILGTVFLCIICNLMGPAVAVLILPTLQYITTAKVGHVTMSSLNYDNVAGNTGFAYLTSGCDQDPYAQANFSCSKPWARNTDALVESYLAAQITYNIFSSQDWLSFSYNSTDWSDTRPVVSYIPSRMIISNLSSDLEIIQAISSGSGLADLSPVQRTTDSAILGGEDILEEQYNAYVPMTQTVQTFLQRNGPILGAVVNYWSAFSFENQWETKVDSSRSIRCYEGWNISNTFLDWGDNGFVGTYTRCIQVGDWNDGTQQTDFAVDSLPLNGPDGGSVTPGVSVKVMQSARVAFLPDGNLPSGFPSGCLPKSDTSGLNSSTTSSGACDWDAFFSSGQNDPLLRVRSRNVTTWEMLWDEEDQSSASTVAVDFSVFQSMAVHSLDTSWITNPLVIANFELVHDDSEDVPLQNPLAIDPAWTLAAFAVDKGGVLDPSRRSVGARLLDVFNTMWQSQGSESQPLYTHRTDLEGVTLMPIMQLLSMVDHNTAVSPGITEKNQDPAHPLLQSYGRLYVWAYGLGSRTSYLGVFVSVVGAAVVILEILLGFIDRRRFRSPTQMLVAALEHHPNDEFRGYKDEKLISRIPFRLTNEPRSAGRLKFEKVG